MKSFRWTEGAVARALGLPTAGVSDRVFPRISTDTRSVGRGDLFVALQGARFDAHEFLAEAAGSGAAGAVVSRVPEGAPPTGLRYFQVSDTLHALGQLGRYRRENLRARVVGVVGSNGKTTTKDLIRAALGGRFRVHATQGNLNNQIGVPITLLATPDDAEVVVVEMGTNEPGEIEILSAIVQPDVVVVTSIGEEHLEKLGDVDGVLREEISVLRALEPDGVVFVVEEPAELPELARAMVGSRPVHVAGFGPSADLRPDGGSEGIRVEPDGSTRWSWQGLDVHLPLPGRFNVRNALLALGLARELGVMIERAVIGVGGVASAKLRGEWRRFGDLRVLADCYNSNPPSVAAAVELLSSLPADGNKVAVLGTMRELGAAAADLHARAAADVVRRMGRGVDLVVATGDFVRAFEPFRAELGHRLVASEDPVAAYEAVSPRFDGTEMILLKASRGEALERWLPLLERDFGQR